jgi:hypothetical protein
MDPTNPDNWKDPDRDKLEPDEVYLRHDYEFESRSFFTQSAKEDYNTIFLSEQFRADEAGYKSWMRRPNIDPESRFREQFSDPFESDPLGLHMLFAEGVGEFKVQIWVEDDSEDYLDLEGLRAALENVQLDNANDDPVNDAGVPSPDQEYTVPGTSQFPRWWPEEDFEQDNIPGEDLMSMSSRIDENRAGQFRPLGAGTGPWNDSDFEAPANATDLSQELAEARGGRAVPPINISRIGVYWGGPYNEAEGPGDTNRLIGQRLLRDDPVFTNGTYPTWYLGLPAEPRAIKITVRLYDANGRFENGQVHSIVIPLSE